MKLALYAHPFDLDALAAHGGLPRVADLGFGEIALAVSYHDGRWLTPWHPQGRVRFLEDGAVHFRPTGDYGVLRPLPSTEVPTTGPSPLEALCAAGPAAGLSVRAWAVFHHNSRLGAEHPDLCVENAFGDRYVYALCPAQPAVQQYSLGIVSDLAAHRGLGAIEFEAIGYLGWKHGSHHDKASFVPRGLLDYALSLCFCARCSASLVAAGGEPVGARSWAQGMVRRFVEQADAMAPEPVLESQDAVAIEGALRAVRAAREQVVSALLARIRERMPAEVTRAVQVHPGRLFSGSQATIPQARGLAAEEHVITAYGEGPAGIQSLLAGEDMFLLEGKQKRLSIWPKAPQFTRDEDLQKVRDLCVGHGIESVAIYHLGLLPWRTIERAARILTA